mgnify:CR=1 FL=1
MPLKNGLAGYDEEGDYTGEGEYDANWNYVGPAPTQETIDAMETGQEDIMKKEASPEPESMTEKETM